MIMEILNICMTKRVAFGRLKTTIALVMTFKAKFLPLLSGISAEIERNLISQRTKEALARLKEGHQIGRGRVQRNKQLDIKCVA